MKITVKDNEFLEVEWTKKGNPAFAVFTLENLPIIYAEYIGANREDGRNYNLVLSGLMKWQLTQKEAFRRLKAWKSAVSKMKSYERWMASFHVMTPYFVDPEGLSVETDKDSQ